MSDGRPRDPAKTPWREPGASELRFHYSREEREAQRTRVWEPPSGGFFRRNRSLTILLVDAVIVVGLFFIFLFVILPLQRRVMLGPYRVEVDAISFEEETVVRARVRLDGDPEGPAQPVVTVAARGAETADLAPRDERLRTIRLNVPHSADGGALEVTVTIGERSHVFTVDPSD